MKKILAVLLIAVLFAAAVYGTVRSRMEPGNSHTGLSSDTKPSAGVIPGDTFTETNTGLLYIYTGAEWVLKADGPVTALDSLTAPGVKAISVNGFGNATIAWQTKSLNTSISHLLQGKVSTSNWFSLCGVDSVRCAANKDSLFNYVYCSGLDSLRYKLISENGGTDAVIYIWTKRGK